MKTFVTEYIRGCTTCQMNKVNTHPTHPPLSPITPEENARPFETIAMDFITKLPPSGEYDTILTITDTDCSKASIFLPCKEAIDSEGVAQLYLTHVLPHYGIPKKIILDRDPQFTSRFGTELCRLLDIQQNISTAYHPQIDGASERTNQTLKQYLRMFCGTQQNNWHTWLPLAQYTKNSWPSATTKKAPFDLIMGYTPRVHQPIRSTDIPTLGKRLDHIKEAREAAQEAQHKAQESWIKDRPQYRPFVIGDKVWLEGTNLCLPANITQKLSPRRYGPFKVAAKVSAVTYKIELPEHWKIHNVFHASLLTPYKETSQHGPNFLEPPPDILEGEPEWEVEKILQTRRFGRNKKKQYLVRWKEYSPSHDSWVDESDMNAPDLVKEFYKSHPAAIRVNDSDNSSHSDNESHDNNSHPVIQECIKTLEISDQEASCPPPHRPPSSSNSSLEIPTFGVLTNTTNSNLELVYTSPTFTHSNIVASAKNTTAPTTDIMTAAEEPCLITPTSPAVDFPLLPYTLLEPTLGSSSSGPTQKEMTYISSLPSSQETNSMSTFIGRVGAPEKMLPTSHMKQSLSPSKDIQSSMKPFNINKGTSTTFHPNNSSHKDTHPYQKKTVIRQEAQKEYSLPMNRNKKPTSQTVDTEVQEASMNQQYKWQRHNPQELKEERRKLTQAFRRMYQQWRLMTELLKHMATADHFRRKSSDMALFLQKIFPPAYDAATKRLRAKGTKLPTPVTSQWARLLNDRQITAGLKLALTADCASNRVVPIPLEGTSCYNPGPGSTNFSYPPVIPTPSSVTITLPANIQPTAPIIPPSFTTAIPEIPITWPTSHTHQYESAEYLEDPAPVVSDNSDEDSPMRTRSPSPAVEPSGSPAIVILEAHEQPSPAWQAWLSQPGPSRPKRRSISPSSEESAPKRQHHKDGSYTPRSPFSPSAQSSATSPNADSPPMQINLL